MCKGALQSTFRFFCFGVNKSKPIGVREIFCQGGAVNHLPKKVSQVAQIFTKESERKEGRITTT